MSPTTLLFSPVRERVTWLAPILLAGALAGCERGADSGATANPVAPGRPGNNERAEVVRPVPGSITESPQVGGSTAQVPAGITGSGGVTKVPGSLQGRSNVPAQPGTGVDGGLKDGPAPRPGAPEMGAGPASGSPNRTNSNAVGQR
jgi:hypothetical protein